MSNTEYIINIIQEIFIIKIPIVRSYHRIYPSFRICKARSITDMTHIIFNMITKIFSGTIQSIQDLNIKSIFLWPSPKSKLIIVHIFSVTESVM